MTSEPARGGRAIPPAPKLVIRGVTCLIAAENPAKSAKWRSVLSRLSSLPRGARVVTASSGGHGVSVALAAQRLGLQAHVVLPSTARPDRIKVLKQAGAELTLVEGTYQACKAKALELEGWFFSGFDDLALLHGHSWMFRQLWPTVPIGGGGIFAGALLALDGQAIGVEHVKARAMSLSVAAGKRIFTEVSGAPGPIAVPQVGSLPYEIVRAYKAKIIAVTDEEVDQAWELLRARGVPAERAGAVGLAGALVTGARHTVVTGLE